MRIAYLVITHAMPDHLGRLVQALDAPKADFFIHVDKKTDITPFLAHRAPNVFFLKKRLSVHWCEWQFVGAALRLMSHALSQHQSYDYLVLLSGACYPIRGNSYIREFLSKNKGSEFINATPMPSPTINKHISRLDRFYRRSDLSLFEQAKRQVEDYWERWTMNGLAPRDWRKGLGRLQPFGGSAWWALSNSACRYIQAFTEAEPDIMKFFENTRVADEMFFQTVLGNSPFASRMRRNLLYTDWSNGGSHPAVITAEHVKQFGAQWTATGIFGKPSVCFTRKLPNDGGLMASLIDSLVLTHETPPHIKQVAM